MQYVSVGLCTHMLCTAGTLKKRNNVLHFTGTLVCLIKHFRDGIMNACLNCKITLGMQQILH